MPNEHISFDVLSELLEKKQYSTFMKAVEELNPVDTAEFLMTLPKDRLPAVFRLLKKDQAADVFAEMDPDIQEFIISAMTDREISTILEDLYLDDAAALLGELPANMVKRIMKNAKPDTRQQINKLLAYPDDSAGSIMTAEFIDLRKDLTCNQAIDYIRQTGVDKETVYVAYVTDSRRVLEGIVPLTELLFAKPDELVSDIMDINFVCAKTHDDQETVAGLIQKYDLLAVPVVDMEGRLVGIVTVDDAVDVMQDEATEDIEKMAAILPTDKPYMKTGVFETWRKRIPWLLLLMVSATFTSKIIGHYESALNGMVALTMFMPMLMDTGGNAGGQSSVTIIRGLSLGDIKPSDVLKVLWKEFRVALLCGAVMGIATFAKVMLVDQIYNDASGKGLMIAFVVSLTLVAAVVVAKIIGTLLPIGAKRIGLDPAVMASPFITTIVDAVTLMLYFEFASFMLGLRA